MAIDDKNLNADNVFDWLNKNPTAEITPSINQLVNEYFVKNPSNIDPETLKRGVGFDKNRNFYVNPTEEEKKFAKLEQEKKDKQTATDTLVKQILGQGLTGKWSGQGHGNPESNALNMAQILSNAGITDIKQFGKITQYEPAEVIKTLYNGQQVRTEIGEDGKTSSYVYEPTGKMLTGSYGDGGDYTYPETRMVAVPKDAKLENVYGVARDNGDYGTSYDPVDPSKIKTVDGKLVADTGLTTFGNKVTGKAIPANYDKAGGNIWSGTFAGKGSTGYGVQFQPDGTPVFYTQFGGSSNDLVNMFQDNPVLGTVAQIGAAYFGGPMGSAALNAAMGKSPEDILKAAAMSYVGNAAGSAVSGLEGITDVLGETGTKLASNVAKQYVGSGGQNVDPVKALLGSGVVSGFMGGEGDGPNSADFTEGYFQPGGEGYIAPTGGDYESVFDPTFGGTMPIYDSGGESVFDPTYGGTMPIDVGDGGISTSSGGKSGGSGGSRAPANLPTGAKPATPGVKPATPGTKIPGAIGSAIAGVTGLLGAGAPGGANAAASKNPAVDEITNLVNQQQQQQQQNSLLSMMMNDKSGGANIKSYKELFGEGLFGDTYVPPSAGGVTAEPSFQPQFQNQENDVEEFFRGGDVTDINTLLQILRS